MFGSLQGLAGAEAEGPCEGRLRLREEAGKGEGG